MDFPRIYLYGLRLKWTKLIIRRKDILQIIYTYYLSKFKDIITFGDFNYFITYENPSPHHLKPSELGPIRIFGLNLHIAIGPNSENNFRPRLLFIAREVFSFRKIDMFTPRDLQEREKTSEMLKVFYIDIDPLKLDRVEHYSELGEKKFIYKGLSK